MQQLGALKNMVSSEHGPKQIQHVQDEEHHLTLFPASVVS